MVLKRVGLSILTLITPVLVEAQTSGTLDTQSGNLWHVAPWTITSGPDPYPTGGGVATFLPQVNVFVGVPPDLSTMSISNAITLSGIDFQGPFRWRVQTSGGGSLTLSSGGAVLGADLADLGERHLIAAAMSGGGAFGLTKIGTGTLTLSGANTYTGGTHVNNGVLEVSNGDGNLGATGTGNGVSLDDGVLRISGFSGFTTSRAIDVGPNDGAIDSLLSGAATFNGVVSGSGDLVITGTGSATFTADNALTGAFTFVSQNGVLTLSGANGALRSATGINFIARGGVVNVDNTGANNNNRLNDSAPISTGIFCLLTLTGNSAVPTTEVAGPLNVAGTTRLSSTANTGQQTNFNFASINRQNNAPLFIAGTNLDQPPGPFVAQITSVSAPGPLIGGGGAPGSTNINILPWVTGKNTTASGDNSSIHVTYDGVSDRLRALSSAEYAAAFGGIVTNNVRLVGDTVAPVNTTVNALVLAPPSPATLSGGPVNITSGSFIHSPTTFFSQSQKSTISAGLNFGAAEGIIHATGNTEISGTITGSGGLTFSPRGRTITLSGANTYSGPTHIYEGVVEFTDGGASGSFGNSTELNLYPGAALAASGGASLGDSETTEQKKIPAGPIVGPLALFIHSGSNQGALARPSPVTVERAERIALLTVLYPGAKLRLTSDGAIVMEVDGNISTQGGSAFTPRTATQVNGSFSKEPDRASRIDAQAEPAGITGPGRATITIGTNSFVALNGNNAQEATEILGHLIVGNNSACGIGPVTFMDNGASIEGSGSIPRMLANDVEMLATTNFAGTAPLTFSGLVTLNGSRNVNVTNTSPTTFNGNVGHGSLTKQGPGTLALHRPNGNDYTGGTTVSAGTLAINNTSGSGTGAGTNFINTGGTLMGGFTLSGYTEIYGFLKPGNSVGTANFANDLVLFPLQTQMEIAGGSSADKVTVAGLLTLGGTVNVQTIDGYTAHGGDVFDLFDWGTLDASSFDPNTNLDLTSAALASGATWDKSQFLVNGTIRAVPGAIALVSASSRRIHGGAGTFDITLPLSGPAGIECRSSAGGNYTLVFAFNNNIVRGNASVQSGTGSVSGSPVFSGNAMAVNLTGVGNIQTLTIKLSNVTDVASQVLADTFVSMRLLIGDTNGNGIVNASDISQTKGQLGQIVGAGNFRNDCNANGTINSSDAALVKSHSGEALP